MRNSLCSTCEASTYQDVEGSTGCKHCPLGYTCPRGSSVPLPATCEPGTYSTGNFSRADDCITCDAGFECPGGRAQPEECRPGTIAPSRRMGRCPLCTGGSYQSEIGQTACWACAAGKFCPPGASAELPCPGGTSSNTTALASDRGCLPVLHGYWAPTGSAVPLACPPSGFLCPGADADGVNTPPGSLPIQLSVGGISSERQVVREVLQLRTTLTLDEDINSIDEVTLKERLARLYNARVQDVTISLGSGSVVVTVGLAAATQDAAAQLHLALNVTSDAELSLALGVNTTRQPDIRIGSVNVTRTEIVQEACPSGFWCSAGYTYACEAGTFNALANADSAMACKYCPPGKYNPLEGQSSNTSCLACPKGTANPKPGGTSMSACGSCPTGTYSGTNGSDVCHACSPGTYSDQMGATACTTCSPGYYCTAQTPIMCSQNTYNPKPGAYLSTNCTACPGRFTSTLTLEGRTSIDDCACSRTFYLAPPTMNLTGMEDECEERCCACPIGTDCPGGVTLANLPVVPGYYRRSPDQIDVRRCPDAAANCLPGDSICAESTSACQGGRNATNATSEMCHSGLTGIFCRACVEPFEFFVHAEEGAVAHCEPCENAVSSHVSVAMAVLASMVVVAAVVIAIIWRHHRRAVLRMLERVWKALVETYSVPNKLKTLIAFYQIATKIEDVYEVHLPPAVRALLQQLRIIISFGIEGYPLACIGADGYTKRLLLWTLTPMALALLAVPAVLLDLGMLRPKRVTLETLFENVMPIVLRLAFVLYPIVTNVAFEAFSCFTFEDGRSWLIADVNIECYTVEHARVTALAGVAIAIYPVGLLVLNALILFSIRHEIRKKEKSTLSNASRFLWSEYKPHVFWWELMEMGRRFLLVGLYVIWPFRQGTMMQVGLANLTANVFLVFQVQTMPFNSNFDNYLAVGCSLSLSVMFLCTIFYKFASLVELPGISDRMSIELKLDYEVQGVLLSAIFIVCVFGALVFSAVLTVEQMRQEREQRLREERAGKARRLRWVDDASEVVINKKPVIPKSTPPSFTPTYKMGAVSDLFHIFLSHVWGTGQDQMRIVKTRLKEMMPDVVPFLDVDDLREGKGAEYVDASSVTLIFVSYGYFASPNCMRELLRAVVTGKPVVTLMESEQKHGGLTEAEVKQQLHDASSPFEKKEGEKYHSMYAMWELTDELTSWGYEMPTADTLYSALFKKEPIEWNRIGTFQDVSMRLIAESILFPNKQVAKLERMKSVRDGDSSGALKGGLDKIMQGQGDKGKRKPVGSKRDRSKKKLAGSQGEDAQRTYLQDELTRLKPKLPKPRKYSGRKSFHVYCSKHNSGALELMEEVEAQFDLKIAWSERSTDLPACQQMLVYLNGLTWTSGAATDSFATEVARAMDAKIPLLLCHEMLGGGGQVERNGCAFDIFFSNPKGATPVELMQKSIYSQIATPLKGGAWRKVSMVMIAQALAKECERSQEVANDSTTSTKQGAKSRVAPSEVVPSEVAPKEVAPATHLAGNDDDTATVAASLVALDGVASAKLPPPAPANLLPPNQARDPAADLARATADLATANAEIHALKQRLQTLDAAAAHSSKPAISVSWFSNDWKMSA